MADKKADDQLLTTIAKSRKEKKALNNAIQKLQEHITNANQRNDILSAELQKCQNKIITLRERNIQLAENNKNILQELVNVKQSLCTLQKDVIIVKEDHIKIKKENEQCNHELDNARNQISLKEDDIRNITEKYESHLEELKSHQTIDDAFSTLIKENEDLNGKVCETQDSLKQSLLNNKQLREENQRLSREKRSLLKENDKVREELKSVILTSNEKDLEVFKSKEDLSAAESKLREQTELCRQKSEEHSLISQTNERLRSRYQAMKAHFDLLNRSLADSENELQQLKGNCDLLLDSNLEKLQIIVRLSRKIRGEAE